MRALLKPEGTNLYKSLVRAPSGSTSVGPERAIYMRALPEPGLVTKEAQSPTWPVDVAPGLVPETLRARSGRSMLNQGEQFI